MHDITKRHILQEGINNVVYKLRNVPLASIPEETVNEVLKTSNDMDKEINELESHYEVKTEKATKVWGPMMDRVKSGLSMALVTSTLLHYISRYAAETALSSAESRLSQSILVTPVTSAITSITAAGASAIPVTEVLAATASSGAFSALTSSISALAATPATAPMAAAAFSSLFGLSLDPIPQYLSQEMRDSIHFMKDVEFLSEHPDQVPINEKVDLLHPKAEILKKLYSDSFVPDKNVFAEVAFENDNPIVVEENTIETVPIEKRSERASKFDRERASVN
ncbi:hypothetical protein BDK51DRAFT_31969 [Blyttiomyces helicus]|uniref:Uncharacterized protein n=1 Tax=Blyttiomyces helicus TaxID=388810 RepID=A0A4P9W9Z4_9FUNG|nr:hypothetical protein BDK51DRAFT_31969 [Blyttiomyces helicus]|eukprot:RKO89022.1 hypothetical protein BDK51DRAFT_31969 [Blyttiomyces helicus]